MSFHGYEGVMSVLCTPLQVKWSTQLIYFTHHLKSILTPARCTLNAAFRAILRWSLCHTTIKASCIFPWASPSLSVALY